MTRRAFVEGCAVNAFFLPGLNDEANPLKSKGLGEFGIRGAAAAVTHVVCNARGIRIRDHPPTLDNVLRGVEDGEQQRRT